MAFEYLSLALAGCLILFAAGWSASSWSPGSEQMPTDLPWVGVKHGIFSRLRTKIGSLGSLAAKMESAYTTYSKNGISYILPGFDKSMVIVPGEYARWLAEQPQSILDASAMQREGLQTDYSLLNPLVAQNAIHEHVIRRDLTRQLGNLIPDIEEELNIGVDSCWGTKTAEWTDVGVYETMMKIVARTSNRIFVGLPLCRNEDYLAQVSAFSTVVVLSSTLIRILPSWIRPFLAWICVLPNRYYSYKASKHLTPFLKARISKYPSVRGTAQEPNDFTSWMLNEAIKDPNPAEKSLDMIALRLMTVNFAAIHTSTFTATNILFDLFSSPKTEFFVRELREEITTAVATNDGIWDKNTISRLVKLDSAIRESLRISVFMTHGMTRLVVAPGGVTMPNGLHLPHGTRVATSTYSIQHDDAHFENAMTYDAFRFSSRRQGEVKHHRRNDSISSSDTNSSFSSCSEERKVELGNYLEGKNLSTVTTSETFLSFGHGRHACPGRFFAATEMKLLLAYIIMHYDIKPMGVRPSNVFMGGSILPPMKATISVRRRVV